MRTEAEIVQQINRIQEGHDDLLGFEIQVLIAYLSFENARPFLKDGTKPEEWKELAVLERESVIKDMCEYMDFAWGKALDHRGISASRSVARYRAWLWLLADDETLAFLDDESNYPQYGAPILKRVCDKYGFPIPQGEEPRRMAEGRKCHPECEDGCGR